MNEGPAGGRSGAIIFQKFLSCAYVHTARFCERYTVLIESSNAHATVIEIQRMQNRQNPQLISTTSESSVLRFLRQTVDELRFSGWRRARCKRDQDGESNRVAFQCSLRRNVRFGADCQNLTVFFWNGICNFRNLQAAFAPQSGGLVTTPGLT